MSVVLPDGAKVKTDYGVSTSGIIGTTKQITDQAGKKRKGINDALGRMVRVIEDPDGASLNTDYVFDTLGNLRKTIQGEQSRYFMHDSLGRLLYAKQPEQDANSAFAATDPVTNNSQWSAKYEYDDSGNITKTTDARGVYVQGTYDKFNRLIYRDYSDATPDVSFYYDGTGLGSVPAFSKGKTTKVASSVSETRYTSFDNLGRLLTHEQRTTAGQLAGTENPYTTAYSYNLSGALLTETYPSGRVVTNVLNQDGELESVWGQKTNQTSAKVYLNQISYNSAGAVEKARLGNGRWETASYNDRQQVTQIGLGFSATDKSLLNIEYDYGTNTQNNGSLRQQKVSFNGLANQITQDYTYDDLNRLKSATETVVGTTPPSWKQTFNYDRFGNRTFDATNTTTMISSKATNPTIQTSDNRFKKDQDNDSINDYDYDANGNLKLDADNQRYIFDAENRIKEFFKSNNSTTNNPNAVYEYDGEGKRVKKINDGVTTIFVYNAGGTLVAEYSTELNPSPKVSYLTADHLGSPRIITDEAGAVISRHDYMAFGDEVTTKLGNVGGRLASQGYGKPDDVRKQYTGYERDKESGLDYAQARYYNSNHGRFTSVDPLTASASIRNPQTFNRYSYVLNSPYKFTDPLGLLPQSSFGGGGGFCGAENAGCDEGEELTTRSEEEYRRQQAEPPPPPPPPPQSSGNGPYDVHGTTFEEAVANANDPAVNGTPNGTPGRADIEYNAPFTTLEVKSEKVKGGVKVTVKVSKVKKVTVKSITVSLPNWVEYSLPSTSQADRDRWDQWVGDLKKHENGHVAIGKAYLPELQKALQKDIGITATAVGKNKDSAVKLASSKIILTNYNNAVNSAQNRQNDFDDITDHGRNSLPKDFKLGPP